MQKLEERPPFVRFETRSEEDREATIQAGHYVGRDVDYAFITPAGSRDVIERNVKEWLTQLDEQVLQERINPAWRNAFRDMYRAFVEGKELPITGTPIINWPGLSPSQTKQLQSLNLRAVEDVAAMNEETIARIGMGGRALKDRAVAYLETASNVGAVAEVSAALKAENADLRRQNEELQARMRSLETQFMAMSQASAGQSVTHSAAISAEDLGLGDKL